MTFPSIVSLFLAMAMAMLAALPSISVLAVTTRAINGGFIHGAMTALGVAVGDIVFIAIAIFGLSFLNAILGDYAFFLRYLGGAYMLWIAVVLWRSSVSEADVGAHVNTPLASFLLGVFITLGDQKAIVFYLGFLPAFMDVESLSLRSALIVMMTALVAVGGVKLGYVLLGDHIGKFLGNSIARLLNRAAAMVMIFVGLYLFFAA